MDITIHSDVILSSYKAEEAGNAETILIPADTLLYMLRGVVVAAKAPETLVQPLAKWIEQYKRTDRVDSPVRGAIHHPPEEPYNSRTLHEWVVEVEKCFSFVKPGALQLFQILLAVSHLECKVQSSSVVTSEELDMVWCLLYIAITHAPEGTFQLTPNRSAQGFVAVPLCSLIENGNIEQLWRLHVWLPDNQRGVSDVAVHAHQPFAQSWILAGSGRNYTYRSEEVFDLVLGTHATYDLTFRDSKDSGTSYKTHQLSSTIINSGKLVKLCEMAQETHCRDMTYTVPSGHYHRSYVPGDRFHATLFVFDAHRGFNEKAGVLGPIDGTEYTQLRDANGISARYLAEMTNAARKREEAGRS